MAPGRKSQNARLPSTYEPAREMEATSSQPLQLTRSKPPHLELATRSEPPHLELEFVFQPNQLASSSTGNSVDNTRLFDEYLWVLAIGLVGEYSLPRKSNNTVLGLPYELACLSFCKSFHLDLLEASATLTLVELWLFLGSSHIKRASNLDYRTLPMILGNGGFELKAPSQYHASKMPFIRSNLFSTDNNLHYSTLPEEFNFSPEVDAVSGLTHTVSPSETSMERASSSVRFLNADKPEPETGKRKGVVGAVMGRIENMLGSITAPPANAEVVSAASAKSLGLMTAPSSVRVTAGMIEIRGFKVMGRAEHWSMDKSGDTRFLLSCGVSSPGGFEPVTKIQGLTMSVAVLLRGGGFYFFFLSAMLLALCLKIGMRVCKSS